MDSGRIAKPAKRSTTSSRLKKKINPSENSARLTDFEKSVYQACRMIPRGKVGTYKGLASKIGCGSCQAVGQALRRNPFPMYAFEGVDPVPPHMVPCHRVVASDFSIGGFNGSTAPESADIQTKIKLLRDEGLATKFNDKKGKVELQAPKEVEFSFETKSAKS